MNISRMTSHGLSLDDLREGDILVMLGPTLAASLICCCGRSWGSSHVGQVMCLDGQLWLAESTPYSADPRSNLSQWVRPGFSPVHDGVCATKIADSFAYYAAIDIYRPMCVTLAELDTMRSEFLRLYGSPYKRVLYELSMKCVTSVGCVDGYVPRGYDCSDLVCHLFGMIGRVISDWNIRIFGYDVVRPYDVPRLIACDRLGNAIGVYAIGDPRSFVNINGRLVVPSRRSIIAPVTLLPTQGVSCASCVRSPSQMSYACKNMDTPRPSSTAVYSRNGRYDGDGVYRVSRGHPIVNANVNRI